MNFALTEDQRAIVAMIRDLARAEAAPDLAALGDLGLLGIMAPAEHGGTGLGLVDACLILEEVAARHPSAARRLQVHNVLALGAILEGGTEAQRAQWAERLATGAAIGSFGRLAGGRLHGVSHARQADVVVGLGDEGFALCSDLSVECESDRLLGLRESGLGDLDAAAVEAFERDAPGAVGAGNVALAAIAVGIGRGAMEHACRYATERTQFGQPIARFQAIQWKVADSATAVDAARALVHRAAWLHDRGKPFARQGAMARSAANRCALSATDHAVQIHGGYGYVADFPVESLYRDARAVALLGGGPDAQRDDVAAGLLAGV